MKKQLLNSGDLKMHPLAELTNILGFDPTKGVGTNKEGIEEVLKELAEERKVKAKAVAKDLMNKAIELAQKRVKAEQEFKKATTAFDKELRKLINTLNNALNGNTSPTQEDSEEQTA
jgi:ribosome recycling factor